MDDGRHDYSAPPGLPGCIASGVCVNVDRNLCSTQDGSVGAKVCMNGSALQDVTVRVNACPMTLVPYAYVTCMLCYIPPVMISDEQSDLLEWHSCATSCWQVTTLSECYNLRHTSPFCSRTELPALAHSRQSIISYRALRETT